MVRQGYKQTEVGVIPKDWNVDCIENLVRITTGSKNTQDRVEDGEYPFFVRSQVVEHINSYAFDTEAVLTAGDGVGTGKVFHYIRGKFDAHQRVYCMLDFCSRLNGYFFYLYFSNHFYHRIMQMTAKSSVDSVRREMISKMVVPLPPTIAEQEAIAEALSDADALIESLEKLIVKKRLIKRGAMQELLTGKKRLSGLSGKWTTEHLGDVIESFIGGGTPSRSIPHYWGDEIPWVTVKDFASFNAHLSQESITRKGLQNSASHLIPKGTLITSTRMGLGKAIIYKVDVAINQDLKALFPKKTLLTQYLYFWFQYNGKLIDELGSGSTVKGISLLDLKKIEIKLPHPSEQTAIAAILIDMDSEIDILEQKLTKARQIKQGMMQELLTGRIRLLEALPGIEKKENNEIAQVMSSRGHNKAFNDAVIIAVLSKNFGSAQYPLGRKRYTKLSYLLYRHSEGVAQGYLKKAAGPYNPATKYGGAEKIAVNKKYVQEVKASNGHGFVASANVSEAEKYFIEWYGDNALKWLSDNFRYKTNDDLELLATVDAAIVELRSNQQDVSVETVKQVLANDPEWKPKLSRAIFSDANIKRAIGDANRLLVKQELKTANSKETS